MLGSMQIDIQEQDYIALRSTKYDDRPLIGQVTSTGQKTATIDWYVGTYSTESDIY